MTVRSFDAGRTDSKVEMANKIDVEACIRLGIDLISLGERLQKEVTQPEHGELRLKQIAADVLERAFVLYKHATGMYPPDCWWMTGDDYPPDD